MNEDDNVLGMIDLVELLSFLASSTTGTTVRLFTLQELLLFASRQASFIPLKPDDKCSLAVELFADGCHRCLRVLWLIFLNFLCSCPLLTNDKLVGLLTQVDVLMEVSRAMVDDEACRLMGQCTLAQYGIGSSTAFVTALKSQSISATIAQLDDYQISSLALVNESGKLVGNFSMSNLLDVWLDSDHLTATLAMPTEEFLSLHSSG
jgi:CBS-domain-containing membrane protein